MKEYNVENVRSIGLFGHGGTGKTSLAEAILYNCRETDRIGKIEDGTTVMDFDPEEKKRHVSISTAVAPCEWRNHRIFLVDTPGYFDFVGEVHQGLRAIDCAVLTTCAVSGLQVGTEKAWNYVSKNKVPRVFFINKLDRENANFEKVFAALKEKYGTPVVPLQVPIGKEADFKGVVDIIEKKAKIYNPKTRSCDITEIPAELMPLVDEYRAILLEDVAEVSEELLEKYLAEGDLSVEEIYQGLRMGIENCDIAPVFCGSAMSNVGVISLLDSIVDDIPSPADAPPVKGINPKTNAEETRKADSKEPFSAFIFKTIADPFIGRLSIFRVLSGSVNADATVYNATQDKTEKFGNIFMLKGKNQVQVTKLNAGDIGAVAKLQFTMTGDTLADAAKPIVYPGFKFPETCISLSVHTKTKGDEDKISNGLHKLLEEDPTFKMSRDVENAELIISGQGELHLEVIASKLKNKFGAEVGLDIPKIPYRETIKKSADVQGKYKKQSGGHGQYGDVHILFEPQYETEGLVFVDKIVGGVVPRNFIPAVEKGLKDAIKKGVLSGCPVINLKATLHYGSYHAVDSSEMAFKTAASMAYKKGMKEANPVLLEPVMHLEVTVPDKYMGDIMGDLNRRRGRVMGMEQVDGNQVVTAEAPLSEIFKYATDLRSMTQSRGSFLMKFDRYEEVPPHIAQKVIEKHQKEKVEEEE